jgi:1-phosphofructokinase family hexose kinase
MIVVVSLNPAVDITHEVGMADWSGVNRPHAVHVRPGGKGVNVARTLRALGADVTLACLAGGGTGRELVAGLAGTGISLRLTPTAGETRRTFAVADLARGTTALFNEPGPHVSAGEFTEFFVAYEKTVAGCSAAVLSGSLPPGLDHDAYARLIEATPAGLPVLLDSSGQALRLGAAAGPAVVKPNLHELEAVAGTALPDLAAAGRAAGELAGLASAGGRRTAVVATLGAEGLLAITPDEAWHARPACTVPGNPTGAGDAVAAALALGMAGGQDWPQMLRHATALAAATIMAPAAGEFGAADYQRHLAGVQVTELTGLPGVLWCR